MSTIILTLDQEAIREALIDYISNMGVDISSCTAQLDMTAGRGSNGYTASVTLTKNKPNKNVVEGLTKRAATQAELDEDLSTHSGKEDTTATEPNVPKQETTPKLGGLFKKAVADDSAI